MKEVQTALRDIGIPVMAGIWKSASGHSGAPPQYVIYSSTTSEGMHADDLVQFYETYVYLNLWSVSDPTPMRDVIREKMHAAGFKMVEETDKGYNQPAYDSATDMFTVQWTWLYVTEVFTDGD